MRHDPGALRAEVAPRLAPERRSHVEAVVRTVETISAAGAWPAGTAAAAIRAAWIHDACKEDGLDGWIGAIEAQGWKPDPWSLAHAPELLHAPAAAAWARARGESDPAVLEAVRHHPTAHAEWGPVGRILFVADFCEPTRGYAADLDTARLLARAGEGEEGLAEAARRVLALRLRHLIASGRAIHPRSVRAWNAWIAERPRR